MTEDNGRATVREVYALVAATRAELRAEIAEVRRLVLGLLLAVVAIAAALGVDVARMVVIR